MISVITHREFLCGIWKVQNGHMISLRNNYHAIYIVSFCPNPGTRASWSGILMFTCFGAIITARTFTKPFNELKLKAFQTFPPTNHPTN